MLHTAPASPKLHSTRACKLCLLLCDFQFAQLILPYQKYRARQEIFCLALSGTFRAFPRVGQRVSLEETPKIKCTKKLRITKENHRNQANPVIFGGDYWTRTSGLLRVKQAL